MGGQSCQVPEFRKAAKIITFSFQAILISIWLPWGVDDVTRRGAELRTADGLRKRQLFPLLSSVLRTQNRTPPPLRSFPQRLSITPTTSRVHFATDKWSLRVEIYQRWSGRYADMLGLVRDILILNLIQNEEK